MNTPKTLACFVIALFVSGCSGIKVPSWIPFTGNNEPVVTISEPDIETPVVLPVKSGRMISPDRLTSGGKVLLVPFRAGEHVVASQELDKIAFRLMQGMSLPLKDNRPYFDILINSEEAETPDFLIDGYFVRKRETANTLTKWFFFRKRYVLSVEGKLMDAHTLEVIATFEDSLTSADPEHDFLHLGFDIGQNIGEFIQENINP